MVTAPRIHCRRTPLQTREPGWHSSMLSPCLSSCASLLLPSPFSSNEPIVHCREASCRRSRPTFARLQSQGCEASAKRPAEGLARLLRGCSRRAERSVRLCSGQEQRPRPCFIAPSTMRRAQRGPSAAPGAQASSGPTLLTSPRADSRSALPMPRQCTQPDSPVMLRARGTRLI